VQEYIQNPFLIGGFKFDLRIYVLVTRVEPLSIFIYKEGIARFATEKYDTNIINQGDERSNFIHLTNFSINKKNKSDPINDDLDPVVVDSDDGKNNNNII
jgi:hypothetical protein